MKFLAGLFAKPTLGELKALQKLEDAFKENEVNHDLVLDVIEHEELSPRVVKELKKMGGDFIGSGVGRGYDRNITGAILKRGDAETAKTALEIYDKDRQKYDSKGELNHAPFTSMAACNPDPAIYGLVIERGKLEPQTINDIDCAGKYIGPSFEDTRNAALAGNLETIEAIESKSRLELSPQTVGFAILSGKQAVVDKLVEGGALEKPLGLHTKEWQHHVNSVAHKVIPKLNSMASVEKDGESSQDRDNRISYAYNNSLLLASKGGADGVISALCKQHTEDVIMRHNPGNFVEQLVRCSPAPIKEHSKVKLFQHIRETSNHEELSPDENRERLARAYTAIERTGFSLNERIMSQSITDKIAEIKAPANTNFEQKQELGD